VALSTLLHLIPSNIAAKVRPAIGPSIVDTDDILKGIVKEANRSALGRGIRTGMTGRQALELL
jgi:uncharacterized protein YunC (DUF1805 family)